MTPRSQAEALPHLGGRQRAVAGQAIRWLRGGPRVAAVAVAVGIGLQIGYPILEGEAVRLVTIASVLALAAAMIGHAVRVRGPRWALGLIVAAGGIGFAAEALGVSTGWPFGSYAYADTLGPALLGVPLLVPAAWLMTAYPCLLAARALVGSRWAWLPAAWTLAAWDLFLDPQMVAAGHWSWSQPDPGLPGVAGIPATNFAGWFLVASIMMLALDRLPRRPRDGHLPHDLLPAIVLGWLWASQVLANLVFFGRPAVAAWGGLAMGLPVLAYLWTVRRGDPR